MIKEIYKDIPGYEGYYKASNLGNIKTVKRIVPKWDGYRTVPVKILKPQVFNKTKYLFVDLCKEGVKIKHSIHRLVGMAFIPNPNNKPQINHIDSNRQNNNVLNLEWVTAKENIHHSSISKMVAQYDLDNNYIDTYNSTNEASKITGINRTYISRCCNNNPILKKKKYCTFKFI